MGETVPPPVMLASHVSLHLERYFARPDALTDEVRAEFLTEGCSDSGQSTFVSYGPISRESASQGKFCLPEPLVCSRLENSVPGILLPAKGSAVLKVIGAPCREGLSLANVHSSPER